MVSITAALTLHRYLNTSIIPDLEPPAAFFTALLHPTDPHPAYHGDADPFMCLVLVEHQVFAFAELLHNVRVILKGACYAYKHRRFHLLIYARRIEPATTIPRSFAPVFTMCGKVVEVDQDARVIVVKGLKGHLKTVVAVYYPYRVPALSSFKVGKRIWFRGDFLAHHWVPWRSKALPLVEVVSIRRGPSFALVVPRARV